MTFEIFREEVGKRLKQFIKSNKYSQKEFCEIVGIGETALSTIISGRGGISSDFIYKIVESFPDFDWRWLLVGKMENNGNLVVGENNGTMQVHQGTPSADDLQMELILLRERVKALEEQMKLKDQIIALLDKK